MASGTTPSCPHKRSGFFVTSPKAKPAVSLSSTVDTIAVLANATGRVRITVRRLTTGDLKSSYVELTSGGALIDKVDVIKTQGGAVNSQNLAAVRVAAENATLDVTLSGLVAGRPATLKAQAFLNTSNPKKPKSVGDAVSKVFQTQCQVQGC